MDCDKNMHNVYVRKNHFLSLTEPQTLIYMDMTGRKVPHNIFTKPRLHHKDIKPKDFIN